MSGRHPLVHMAVMEGGLLEVEEYLPESGVGGVWCGMSAIGLVALTPCPDPPQTDKKKRPWFPKFVGL